jgi:hypothetical protein
MTGVLQHIDRVGKACDAVLEAASEKAGRDRICEDHALAFSEPLQASTGAVCFEWQNATDEFQRQGECLE